MEQKEKLPRYLHIVSAQVIGDMKQHASVPDAGYALYYFIESHTLLRYRDKTRDVPRRTIAMFDSATDFEIQGENSQLCEIIFAPCGKDESQFDLYDEADRSPEMQQLFSGVHRGLLRSDAQNLYPLLLYVLHALHRAREKEDTAVRALVSSLFIKLANNYVSHNWPNVIHFIAEAQAYIFDHHLESIHVSDIARHLGISQSYLQGLFLRYKHHTITSYINHLRVDDAALLLLFSKKTIEEVSTITGFHSRQHFTQVFTQQMGVSPGRYRRLHLDDVLSIRVRYQLEKT